MSKALTLFIPKVAVEVGSCPRPIMIDAIKQTIVRFCELSNSWKETLPAIPVLTTVRAIVVTHPSLARVLKILRANYNATGILSPIIPSRADELYPNWDIDLSGSPEVIFMVSDDEIRLAPHPSVAANLVVEAVLRPSEDTTVVPDFIWLTHAQLIADGAKAHLMAQFGVDWSNPERAKQLQEQFDAGAMSLNVAQGTGYTRARLRSRLENR